MNGRPMLALSSANCSAKGTCHLLLSGKPPKLIFRNHIWTVSSGSHTAYSSLSHSADGGLLQRFLFSPPTSVIPFLPTLTSCFVHLSLFPPNPYGYLPFVNWSK